MKWKQVDSDTGAEIMITIESKQYPNGDTTVYGPITMTEASEYITMRLLGRLIRITVESSDLDSWWRLGNLRMRIAPAGRR
jgi:hypothetical protein